MSDHSNDKRRAYEVRIDDKTFTLRDPEPTGRELLALVGRDPGDFFLVFLIEGQPDLTVEPDDPFDLSAPGTERLILVSKSRHFAIRIDETNHNVVGPVILGRLLFELAGKDPETHLITLSLDKQVDDLIAPDEKVDLSRPGREQFFVAAKNPLTIIIDDISYQPGAKEMTGLELRNLPNPPLPPTRDLWLDVRGPDDRKIQLEERVKLKDEMVFYTAPSTINPGGGS